MKNEPLYIYYGPRKGRKGTTIPLLFRIQIENIDVKNAVHAHQICREINTILEKANYREYLHKKK